MAAAKGNVASGFFGDHVHQVEVRAIGRLPAPPPMATTQRPRITFRDDVERSATATSALSVSERSVVTVSARSRMSPPQSSFSTSGHSANRPDLGVGIGPGVQKAQQTVQLFSPIADLSSRSSARRGTNSGMRSMRSPMRRLVPSNLHKRSPASGFTWSRVTTAA